jgi:hypothetical protein
MAAPRRSAGAPTTTGADMGTDLDGVLRAMDREIDRAIAVDDPRGHFACVYRAVTARVRDGIDEGLFDDGERMEQFDVVFAQRWLDAVDADRRGLPVTASWRTTFDAVEHPLLVLQHVLLGMNAHINLDLGIAAAATAPGHGVHELRDDFERINDVLADMIDRMQSAIASVSPWTATVDRVGLRFDESLTSWSLQHARARSWTFAEQLATTTSPDALVAERDRAVAALGRRIARPGVATRWVSRLAQRREHGDVATVAAALRDRGAGLPRT